LDYVHTSKNLADQFTKGLSRNVIESASRDGYETHLKSTLVVTCPMWSEIPWIRMVKHASSRLWGKIHSFNSSLVHVFPFCKVGWFYLNVFLLRCCPTKHILRNTPIWDRLLVTVYEIWVISKFSWKGTEVWLICFKQRGCLFQPSTSKGLEWTSFHTKLSIQGLVHCIVVNE
jgi:hypothetical protein